MAAQPDSVKMNAMTSNGISIRPPATGMNPNREPISDSIMAVNNLDAPEHARGGKVVELLRVEYPMIIRMNEMMLKIAPIQPINGIKPKICAINTIRTELRILRTAALSPGVRILLKPPRPMRNKKYPTMMAANKMLLKIDKDAKSFTKNDNQSPNLLMGLTIE